MRNRKIVKGEIVLRSEAVVVSKPDLQATLERMVRERVDEIMAQRDSQVFEPDFRSKTLATGIMRRQTVFDRQKHALYFEKWGCRLCGRKTVPHSSNAHCHKCFHRLTLRYQQLQLEWDRAHPQQQVGISNQSQLAKRVLGTLPTEGEE
jgi:hypothetical protein